MYRPIAITVVATCASTTADRASDGAKPRSTLVPRASLFARLRQAFAVRQERRALAAMDAQQLDDIGLTETQARKEARRRLFDLPQRAR